jgi:hypothetical protein
MTQTQQNPDMQPSPDTRPGYGNYHWMGAAVLIALGVIFFLRQAGVIALGENWWVVFLLLPAGFLFFGAWQRYQAEGRVASSVWGQLFGGIVLLIIALTFLFRWNWDLIWPAFLVIGGLLMLLRRRV